MEKRKRLIFSFPKMEKLREELLLDKKKRCIFLVMLLTPLILIITLSCLVIYLAENWKTLISICLVILSGLLAGFPHLMKVRHLPLISGFLFSTTLFATTWLIPVLFFSEPITPYFLFLSIFVSVFTFVLAYEVTRGAMIMDVENNLKRLLLKCGVDTACYLDPTEKPYEYFASLAEGKYSNAIKGKQFTITEVFDSPRIKEVTPMDNELFRMFREVAVIPKKLHYSTYPRMLEGFVVVGVNGEGKRIDERVIK